MQWNKIRSFDDAAKTVRGREKFFGKLLRGRSVPFTKMTNQLKKLSYTEYHQGKENYDVLLENVSLDKLIGRIVSLLFVCLIGAFFILT